MNHKSVSYLCLLVAVVLGGATPVLLGFGKSVNIYEFIFLISIFGLISSLIFIVIRGKTEKFITLIKDPKQLSISLIAGILSLLPIEFGIGYAEHSISVSLATAIFRTFPLLMLIFIPILLRERLSKYQIAALGLGFVGLYIGISGGSIISFSETNLSVAIFMATMALAFALSLVLIKRFQLDTEIQIAGSNLAFFIFAIIMFIANDFPTQQLGSNIWIIAFYIGAIFNVYSFYMAYYALRRVKTTIYANMQFLAPFITFVLAYLFLGEPIATYYIVIALTVAVGVVIQQFDKIGGTYLPKSKNLRIFIFDVTGTFAETNEMTINKQLNKGGKALAVKLPVSCKRSLSDLMNLPGVYTSYNPNISKEAALLRDTIKIDEIEFLLIKVGKLEECESFFHNVEERFDISVTK